MCWATRMFVALVLVTGVGSGRSRAQMPPDSNSATPVSVPKIIPWLELGPGQEALDNAAHGLLVWRLVADAAIISVGPEDAPRLRRLHARIADIRIIPGLKTSPILIPAGFDSVAGWQKIAQAVRTLCEATGEKTIVFEHESAIKSYIDGRYVMNWGQLGAGLRLLPVDYAILWYPSAAMDGEILARYVRLAETVGELPNVRFIDHASFYAPKFVGAAGTLNAVRQLEAVARHPPVRLVYCCGPDFWPYERVPEALRQIHEDTAIVYPGATRWVEAARALSRILPARSSASQPASEPAGR